MAAQGEAALWEEALSLLWIMVSNRSLGCSSRELRNCLFEPRNRDLPMSSASAQPSQACTAGSTWELALELLGSMSKEGSLVKTPGWIKKQSCM